MVIIYALNVGIPNFLNQTLVRYKTQIDCNKTIVGNFNTPLSSVDRSFRQKKSVRKLQN
jgi:hypothetical protein